MAYVDGYVLPLKKDKIDAYRQMAALAGSVWREHGALEYREWIAEDVKAGEHTSFPQAVKLEDDEIVVFSWAVYADRKSRDEIMAKVMADPRMEPYQSNMPFDGKRMIFGGFDAFLGL